MDYFWLENNIRCCTPYLDGWYVSFHNILYYMILYYIVLFDEYIIF